MTNEALNKISLEVLQSYNATISSLPFHLGEFMNILVLVLVISLYALFIWKLYHFVAKKDFLGLNLSQKKDSEGNYFSSPAKVFLYFLEYLIISPFLIFFWFVIFGIFMIVIINSLDFSTILLASTVILASIRVTSYYNEPIAKELAKLIPLNLLAFAIITPGFFNVGRIISLISTIPTFFNNILIYFFFIFLLEAGLRLFDFSFSLILEN